MRAALTADRFSKLLSFLDADRERAGDKYEELRRMLIRFFEWRGAWFAEEHADEVLNRLAKKIEVGVNINNVGAYCHEIARLVLLEFFRGSDYGRTSLGSVEVTAPVDTRDVGAEKELRLECLDDCLRTLPEDNRDLILEYYQDAKRDRIERRKALAERLGVNREAMANRAQRLRIKLEQCVTRCLAKKTDDMSSTDSTLVS
jgi:DNA-directed RNA polymerase specialized sigma24 family protein